MLVALAGGVGAARFLAGLVRVVPAEDVVIIGNTGDDDTFYGLAVSPDLDTVTYTLAETAGEAGWGLAGDTFRVLDGLGRYGEPTWFRLGDADLATHLHRTHRLAEGATLSEVTAEITRAWRLKSRLVPMTDGRVRTMIDVVAPPGPSGPLSGKNSPSGPLSGENSPSGPLSGENSPSGPPSGNNSPSGPPSGSGRAPAPGIVTMKMQEWFVRERWEPAVHAVRFEGADTAEPAPGVLAALADADAVLLCPSNPVISIGPILALPGVRAALAARRERVVGVSPIIRGAPVRGPADRLMAAVGLEVSCAGVAAAYADICSALLVDEGDRARAADVERLGVRAEVAPILMGDADGAARLAARVLDLLA